MPTPLLRRREFQKPFAAALLTTLLACPTALLGQSQRPFQILVVGDSLIWGQGLEENDKIYTHIANWLRNGALGSRREVNLKVKAHSGSTLKFHEDEAEAFRKAGRDETFHYKPEVNVSFPSTWKQIEVAASEYRAAGKTGADLILLSGCITDITVAKVLDPKGDNELLKQLAKKYCHDDMLELLGHAAQLHPETAIAVVGYFPMISPKSNGKRLFNGWLEARGTNRFLKWMMNNPFMRRLYFQKVGDKAAARSRLWFEESSKQLQAAVDDLNRNYERPRAVFVRSPLTEENSVEAPNTLLFRMGKNGIPEDPAFSQRKVDCDAALPELKRSTGLDYPLRFCEVAGVGHPNPSGTRKYADAVIAALPMALPAAPEWANNLSNSSSNRYNLTLAMKIAVAMSGGVDSSAAAALLKEQGHELVGFTMQLWNQRRHINVDENGDPLPSRCCSLDDVYDARRVAESLGFPFYVLNLEEDFERDVVEPFVQSYLSGETPIPCVACNSRLKFASLDRMAQSLDCDKVATGHYARVEYDEVADRYRLFRGRNHWKDQSYFLWELTQDQLSRAYFPLGEMVKEEVREIAREANLYTAEKAESQEICFVPDGKYSEFIDRFLDYEDRADETPSGGEIVNAAGEVVGSHTGIHRYTIGQRRGLGIANEKPLYVVQIERAKNQIIVGEADELESTEFVAKGVNWVAFDALTEPVRAEVKVRYRHDPSLATIHALPDDRARIVFDEPQRAITPGQATIFYHGDEVVGGGWIVKN